ncbi:uncharacterized protein K441DRAFT_571117, partial [Cenococcum geophilum 1.58]|uniref:uncharacterized protein n=1 Tax=Cenococcum geophilum 1.58 TaxID=794803 RepID=UPI00358EA6D2
PRHLLLDYNLYREERREMQKKLSSSLFLKKLFCTLKGKEALFLFLSRTGITNALSTMLRLLREELEEAS